MELTRSKNDGIPHHDVVRIGTARDTDGGIRSETFKVSNQTSLGSCGLQYESASNLKRQSLIPNEVLQMAQKNYRHIQTYHRELVLADKN